MSFSFIRTVEKCPRCNGHLVIEAHEDNPNILGWGVGILLGDYEPSIVATGSTVGLRSVQKCQKEKGCGQQSGCCRPMKSMALGPWYEIDIMGSMVPNQTMFLELYILAINGLTIDLVQGSLNYLRALLLMTSMYSLWNGRRE